ncbi:MAG TPA: 50S ribosomal protein L30 [Thermoleophilaceae bacterium]|nr:50S ribosomal protein L30 [Thermoleophilaceae bacterium]
MAATLKLKQVKSPNKSSQKQRDSLRTLGLGRIGKTSERPDDPVVQGQLSKVGHLVVVETRETRRDRGNNDG